MAAQEWSVPQQGKLKYTQLFNLHDRTRSGFLSGLQCRDILLQSGLPRNTLAEIWNLSDIDGDGQLTREEFILAMHLTNLVRAGQTLPGELPADLVPPSYRRTRSISSTSVHSLASAGSSSMGAGSTTGALDDTLQGSAPIQQPQKPLDSTAASSFGNVSIVSSNSFEDKRRENFERGRAELERRRLKTIEQQSGTLREQLEASKKQVVEAKAKIDAMRSDRDTKAGLITSLDAQIKTLLDRKAYLQYEEANLIAIAKDLKLTASDSNQVELDKLATQEKQRSIAELRVRVEEYLREKDSKAKELAEASQRLEQVRKELEGVVEACGKSYEIYKQKVATAKTMKAQFMDENKSKTVDLDSVWDSEPSFVTPNSHPDTTFTSTTNDDPWAANNTSSTNDAKPESPFATTLPATTGAQSNLSSSNQDFFLSSQPSPNIASKSTAPLTQPPETNSNNNNNSINRNEFENDLPEAVQTTTKRYHVLYAFEARNPDELTINPGDIIVGAEVVTEPGWLSGELNGKSGLFPEAYVEPFTFKLDDEINNKTADLQPSAGPGSFSMQSVISEKSFKDTGNLESVRKYKVLYAFEARNPDELNINPGDIITGVAADSEPGWLMGELNGQKGLFPEAYVERFEELVPQEQQPESGKLQRMSSVGSLRSKKSSRSARRAEVATVIANYRALGQEQLSLEKGQLILIRRKMDSGWWEGELQLKGKKKQFGWFPSSYVKLMSTDTQDPSAGSTQ